MFSYNPEKICADGLDEIRFTLGDCNPCDYYLHDEEILAVLAGSRSLKAAEFKLVGSLLHRFSFDATKIKIHEAEFDFSKRVAAWKDLYDALAEELKPEEEAQGVTFGFAGRSTVEPYFKGNQMDYV